eukprot:806153-Rhodomonas_salina.1
MSDAGQRPSRKDAKISEDDRLRAKWAAQVDIQCLFRNRLIACLLDHKSTDGHLIEHAGCEACSEKSTQNGAPGISRCVGVQADQDRPILVHQESAQGKARAQAGRAESKRNVGASSSVGRGCEA